MAHVEDRWYRKARDENGKILRDEDGKPILEKDPQRYGKGARWRLGYVGPDGRERNESFGKKSAADRRKVQVEADLQRGEWIDPNAWPHQTQTWANHQVRRPAWGAYRDTWHSSLRGGMATVGLRLYDEGVVDVLMGVRAVFGIRGPGTAFFLATRHRPPRRPAASARTAPARTCTPSA